MSNLKKYHVSKNLFDEIYPNLSTNIQYLPINVGSGQFTSSTTTPIQGTSASLWIMSGNVSSGAALSNNLYKGQNRTVTAIDGYITIAYRKTVAAGSPEINPSDYDTMINSGSTALSYEPYSADVWHDLAPEQYVSGEFITNANIPEKYQNGTWD